MVHVLDEYFARCEVMVQLIRITIPLKFVTVRALHFSCGLEQFFWPLKLICNVYATKTLIVTEDTGQTKLVYFLLRDPHCKMTYARLREQTQDLRVK